MSKQTHSVETVASIVRQSREIHPGWDGEMHLAYLEHEEGIHPFDNIAFPVSGPEQVANTVRYWIDKAALS